MQAGNVVFKVMYKPTPVDFLTSCDQKADTDPDVPFPKTGDQPVSFIKKQLLKDTSPWLTQPDYDRVGLLYKKKNVPKNLFCPRRQQ